MVYDGTSTALFRIVPDTGGKYHLYKMNGEGAVKIANQYSVTYELQTSGTKRITSFLPGGLEMK